MVNERLARGVGPAIPAGLAAARTPTAPKRARAADAGSSAHALEELNVLLKIDASAAGSPDVKALKARLEKEKK